jgi:hypothetical protein
MKARDVLIDRNARTAIVLGKGRKLTTLVPMEEGELVVRVLSPEDMDERGFRLIDYPFKRAVRKYLKHSGGISGKARSALKALLTQEVAA